MKWLKELHANDNDSVRVLEKNSIRHLIKSMSEM